MGIESTTDQMKVEFFKHSLGPDEIKFVTRAMNGIFLTSGPLTLRFEEEFARYLDCKKVIGTYSCTTALFLCLKALGIGPGDQVITSPMTFIATSNVIIEAGATPVFVDVESSTGNIDAGVTPEMLVFVGTFEVCRTGICMSRFSFVVALYVAFFFVVAHDSPHIFRRWFMVPGSSFKVGNP